MPTIAENLSAPSLPGPTEIRVDKEPVGYEEAVAFMEQRVADINAGEAPEMIWFLEHPPLLTAGTSTRE